MACCMDYGLCTAHSHSNVNWVFCALHIHTYAHYETASWSWFLGRQVDQVYAKRQVNSGYSINVGSQTKMKRAIILRMQKEAKHYKNQLYIIFCVPTHYIPTRATTSHPSIHSNSANRKWQRKTFTIMSQLRVRQIVTLYFIY